MENLIVCVSLVFGGALLFYGGDYLVDNAKKLGIRYGIDPMVIGLTIVAFGTSAPELFVSAQGALTGKPDLALGNIVGSCITNVLLILGISAILTPIKITKRTVVRDVPVMLGVSILFLLLSLDLVISRIDGLILFLLLIVFLVYEVRSARAMKADIDLEINPNELKTETASKEWLMIGGALIALVIGSNLLIFGAAEVARFFGISELVIGLTIVALGTSLPEVVTSCIAAYKGESSIAIGNVVGSNIFNILAVMGFTAMLVPVPVALAALSFDIPIMIFSALACIPIIITDRKISRGEGVILLMLYVFYITYLTLMAKDHAEMPVVSEILIVFILPLAGYYFLTHRNKISNS